MRMKGREVFRHAVTNLADVLGSAHRSGFVPSDIDWVVPHQANARIIDATAKQAGPAGRAGGLTVDQHANTSAASVPLALDTCGARWAHQARRPGRARGDGRRLYLGCQPDPNVTFQRITLRSASVIALHCL
jgi:hypothetical protein